MKGSCAVIAFAALLCLSACTSGHHPASRTGTLPGASPSADVAGPASPRPGSTGAGQASAGPGTASTKSASVTIAAVGDTMLGNTPDLPPDPAAYFRRVEPILGGAQIVFGNLEGTLTTATISKCGPVKRPHKDCFAFRDPPGRGARGPPGRTGLPPLGDCTCLCW